MTKETKYYCDECGKELGRGVCITVLVTNQYQYDLDKWDLEKFNRIPYTHKIVYNKSVCPECLGEEIKEYSGTEPRRDFGLIEKGLRFLVKHKFLRIKEV